MNLKTNSLIFIETTLGNLEYYYARFVVLFSCKILSLMPRKSIPRQRRKDGSGTLLTDLDEVQPTVLHSKNLSKQRRSKRRSTSRSHKSRSKRRSQRRSQRRSKQRSQRRSHKSHSQRHSKSKRSQPRSVDLQSWFRDSYPNYRLSWQTKAAFKDPSIHITKGDVKHAVSITEKKSRKTLQLSYFRKISPNQIQTVTAKEYAKDK